MKLFFEKINARFLTFLLIGCGIFIFLFSSVSKLFAISLSFVLFLFLFAWLLYQSKKERISFLIIFLILLLVAFVTIVVVVIDEKSTKAVKPKITTMKEYEKRHPHYFLPDLPKEIVRIGTIKYIKPSRLPGINVDTGRLASAAHFSIEIENVSEKYRIEHLIISLTAYKDGVVFYKGEASFGGTRHRRPFDTSSFETMGLNPKGNTSVNCYIENVSPYSFPPKPWTFSTTVESVKGKPF